MQGHVLLLKSLQESENMQAKENVQNIQTHWEKFNTREMKVRIEVVRFQSQLVVQIENFAFFNESQYRDWANQSKEQLVLQNELLVLETICIPNVRICHV